MKILKEKGDVNREGVPRIFRESEVVMGYPSGHNRPFVS